MNYELGPRRPTRRELLRSALPVAGVGLVSTALGVREAASATSAQDGTSLDESVSGLLADPMTRTAIEAATHFARASQVNVLDFGAVADFDRESTSLPTDNLPCFRKALEAVSPGGKVYVPPGKYYLSDTLVITKAVDFDCGRGGFETRASGTQLVWPANTTGIHVTSMGGVRPSDFRIGPFELTGLSAAVPGDGSSGFGIYCTDGFGFIDAVSVNGFSSHGIYLRAGTKVGGGNVNNTDLHRVRCYGNGGDGIKCHGSDAQQVRIWGPDIVANAGWGINMEGASANRVYAPHIDQQYHGSPGAIRDAGNSNVYDDVYTEHGDGNGERILLSKSSVFARITTSQYGRPTIDDQTLGKTAVIFDSERGFLRQLNLVGGKGTRAAIDLDVSSEGAFRLTLGETRVFNIESVEKQCHIHYSLVPGNDNQVDLGSKNLRFRNASFASFIRVGVVTHSDRPAASQAGVGAQLFDSSIGRPIWSDGFRWVDSEGKSV